MQVGAFMQFLASAPIGQKSVGPAEDADGKLNWQRPGDSAAPSFLQTIKQLLDQRGDRGEIADSDNRTPQYPPDDATQVMLLMQLLGREGAGEFAWINGSEPFMTDEQQTVGNTDPALMMEIPESELLNMLNAQLSELGTLLGSDANSDSDDQTDLLTLINKKLFSLETSINALTPDSHAKTKKDIESAFSLIKTELASRLGQTTTEGAGAPVLESNPDSGLEHTDDSTPGVMKVINEPVVQQQDRVQSSLSGRGVAFSEASSAANSSDTMAMTDRFTHRSTNSDLPGPGERESALPETAGTGNAEGKPVTAEVAAKSADTPNRTTILQQASDPPPQAASMEKAEAVHGHRFASRSMDDQSTVSPQAQGDVSNQERETAFSNDPKPSSFHDQPARGTENEPAKATLPNSGKTDSMVDGSADVSVSNGSQADNKPMPAATTRDTFTAETDGSRFQKTVMDQIVERATLRSSTDRSEVRIQLKPDTLGDVRMSIVSEKNQLVVQMIAEKSETKEIIEGQIHHLKAELDKQGLTVNRIEVMISANNDQQDSRGQFFQMFKHGADGDGKRQNSAQEDSAHRHQPNDESATDSSSDGINYFA